MSSSDFIWFDSLYFFWGWGGEEGQIYSLFSFLALVLTLALAFTLVPCRLFYCSTNICFSGRHGPALASTMDSLLFVLSSICSFMAPVVFTCTLLIKPIPFSLIIADRPSHCWGPDEWIDGIRCSSDRQPWNMHETIGCFSFLLAVIVLVESFSLMSQRMLDGNDPVLLPAVGVPCAVCSTCRAVPVFSPIDASSSAWSLYCAPSPSSAETTWPRPPPSTSWTTCYSSKKSLALPRTGRCW